jgi:hypothetical protein
MRDLVFLRGTYVMTMRGKGVESCGEVGVNSYLPPSGDGVCECFVASPPPSTAVPLPPPPPLPHIIPTAASMWRTRDKTSYTFTQRIMRGKERGAKTPGAGGSASLSSLSHNLLSSRAKGLGRRCFF